MRLLLMMVIFGLTISCSGVQVESEAIQSNETVEEINTSSSESEQVALNAYQRYFEGIGRGDLDLAASAFSSHASLRVVTRELASRQAIRQFIQREVEGGLYEIYRVEEKDSSIRILLQFTPESWSNPEPMAVYHFVVKDDEIIKADLQYATESDLEYFKDLRLEKSSLLPNAFATYLKGVDEDDSELLVSAFTEGAAVKDVNRLIEGKDNIQSWTDREVLFLTYSVGKMVYTENGVRLYNNIKLSPTSSGFYGVYDLRLKDHLIEYADLQYASESDLTY